MIEFLAKVTASINIYTILFFKIFEPTEKAIFVLYEVFGVGITLISSAIFWYKYRNEKKILNIFKKCESLPIKHKFTLFVFTITYAIPNRILIHNSIPSAIHSFVFFLTLLLGIIIPILLLFAFFYFIFHSIRFLFPPLSQ